MESPSGRACDVTMNDRRALRAAAISTALPFTKGPRVFWPAARLRARAECARADPGLPRFRRTETAIQARDGVESGCRSGGGGTAWRGRARAWFLHARGRRP